MDMQRIIFFDGQALSATEVRHIVCAFGIDAASDGLTPIADTGEALAAIIEDTDTFHGEVTDQAASITLDGSRRETGDQMVILPRVKIACDSTFTGAHIFYAVHPSAA